MKQTVVVVGTPPGKLDVKITLEADFEQQIPAMEALAHYLDGEQVELMASYEAGKVTIEFVAEHPVHIEHAAEQAEAAAAHAVERDSIARGEAAPNRAEPYDGPPPDHALAPAQQLLAQAAREEDGIAEQEAENRRSAAEADIAARHEPTAEDLDAVAGEQATAEATKGPETVQ